MGSSNLAILDKGLPSDEPLREKSDFKAGERQLFHQHLTVINLKSRSNRLFKAKPARR